MKKPSASNSGVTAPLLPEVDPIRRKSGEELTSSSSMAGAVFNVSTSIIGAGIMSIPATLKVLGVAPALVMVVVIAVLTDISVEFLLRYTRSGFSTTYAGVMGESFGRLGSALVQISVTVTNWGCQIIYLIIIGDVVSGKGHHSGLLQEWFGSHWWNQRAYALLFVVVFILLPLVLQRRVDSLRFSSAIAVLLAIIFVIISTVLAISALFQGRTQTPKLLPDFSSNASSFFELFTAIPVIVTAFTFHFNVHPIESELEKRSDMESVVQISLVLCAAIYFSVGFFGYLLFGDSIMPDILVNFDNTASDSNLGLLLINVVRLSYALHLVLVFPLINFPLRSNIDEVLFPKKPVLADDSKRFVCITLALLVMTYIAAIGIPNIWYFFQFIGSTTAVSLAFIFPAAIILRDKQGISTKRDKGIALVMVCLAVITSTIAIGSNLYSLRGSNS